VEKTTIFGDNTSFSIDKMGAELISVKDKLTDYEFMWQADAKIWPRYAPVLFPFVGKSASNQILHCGKVYEMGQHGFARDNDFEISELYTDLVTFTLKSEPGRFPQYPFEFMFSITYQVLGDDLKITYKTINSGESEMFFSVGAHPGFALPIANLSEYEIRFNQRENLETHLLSSGLFSGEKETLLENGNILPLNKEIFEKDALVFKNLNSNSIELKHIHSNFGIKMDFSGFPYLGIWAKVPNEDFICLEPWQGLADKFDFTGEISEREGIIKLLPGETHELSYTIGFTSPN
jgi:galactose mutarotase-like enzyme